MDVGRNKCTCRSLTALRHSNSQSEATGMGTQTGHSWLSSLLTTSRNLSLHMTLLWLHFPWNSLNFWLGLRRNCYWHSKHTLLSELNRGSWDIEVLHSSGTSFVSQWVPLSVLQEHCEIFVENSWVCTLPEESLISANYQSFLKLLAISFQSFHLTENILSLMFLTFIYYFMEKHLKLPQLRNHHLIAWLETGMKTKRWWPLHWRL